MTTNLKKLREAKGIQQQHMAKLLGYTTISYNKVENGKRGLPASKALKAAEILGCSMDEIFLPSDSPKCLKNED